MASKRFYNLLIFFKKEEIIANYKNKLGKREILVFDKTFASGKYGSFYCWNFVKDSFSKR